MALLDVVRRLYGPVVVQATIPAPPDEVYGVLADPSTYPNWLVGAQRVRAADRRFPDRGAEFQHTVGAQPVTVDDSTKSLGAEPERYVALVVNAGPFHARVDFDLEPGGAGETLLRFSEQPIGALSVFTPAMKPVLSLRNQLSMRRLAEQVAA
jgi:uncharacterized protein YndB with AHSA1/START domain